MNSSDRTINALLYRSIGYQQSENAQLPYTWDYNSLLNGVSTISTSSWSSRSNGVTISGTSNTDNTTTATITGQPGRHRIINKVVTSSGLTDERIIDLVILSNDGFTQTGDYS